MTPSPAFLTGAQQKLFRMIGVLLDHVEQRIAPLDAPDDPLRTALLRDASDIMYLWRVCENSACYRARCCRRNNATCVGRFAPLLPPQVRATVTAKLLMLKGQFD